MTHQCEIADLPVYLIYAVTSCVYIIFCILRYIYAYSCVKYYDRLISMVNVGRVCDPVKLHCSGRTVFLL